MGSSLRLIYRVDNVYNVGDKCLFNDINGQIRGYNAGLSEKKKGQKNEMIV